MTFHRRHKERAEWNFCAGSVEGSAPGSAARDTPRPLPAAQRRLCGRLRAAAGGCSGSGTSGQLRAHAEAQGFPKPARLRQVLEPFARPSAFLHPRRLDASSRSSNPAESDFCRPRGRSARPRAAAAVGGAGKSNALPAWRTQLLPTFTFWQTPSADPAGELTPCESSASPRRRGKRPGATIRGEKAERPVLTARLPAAGLGRMLRYRWLRATMLLICVQTQPTWPRRWQPSERAGAGLAKPAGRAGRLCREPRVLPAPGGMLRARGGRRRPRSAPPAAFPD